MTFRPSTESSSRAFAAMSALVVSLLLVQLAGPLVHHVCPSGPEGPVHDGVASLHEFDESALEQGHEAHDCVACRSLTQSRDDFLAERIQHAAPTATAGSLVVLPSQVDPQRPVRSALSPRAPPVA